MAHEYIAPASAEVTNISLRGSLASEYHSLLKAGKTPGHAMATVLRAAKGKVTSYVVGDTRIIGYTSERYQFPKEGW